MSGNFLNKQKGVKMKIVKAKAKKKPILKRKVNNAKKKKKIKTAFKIIPIQIKKIDTVKLNELISKQQEERFIFTEEDKIFLSQHKNLKLQIELVPRSCFFSNIRSVLKKSQWDKIRNGIYSNASYRCQICGGQGTKHPVECHEVWIYEDETLIQRLEHFQAICPLCHEVKHLGLAGIRGNYVRATNRFIEVNEIDEDTANYIIEAVFKQWRIRSKQKWKFDIERLNEFEIDITSLVDKSILKRKLKHSFPKKSSY